MYKNNLVTQIVAVNNLGFIGKNDQLMWRNKEDLAHFKSVTMWNALIVGRKTMDTLPKAVQQGRYLIEVSRSGLSIEDAFEKADGVANNESIYVIGGSQIYKETAKYTDFILLSRIDDDQEGDVSFKVPDEFEQVTSHDYGSFVLEIWKRKTSFVEMDFQNTTNSWEIPLLGTGEFELTTEPLKHISVDSDEEIIQGIEETTFKIKCGYWEQSYEGFEIITNKQVIQLGISSGQSCCESFGYFMSHDDLDEYVGSKLTDINITDTALYTHEMYETLTDSEGCTYEGGVMFVNIYTNKGRFQFVAYNQHNGYYAHDAVVKSIQLHHEDEL